MEFRGPRDGNGIGCLIVADYLSSAELHSGKSFTGPAGYELERMLAEAGISMSRCRLAFVARAVAPTETPDKAFFGTKGKHAGCVQVMDKWAKPSVAEGITELQAELAEWTPKLIITLGNAALWAMTGLWGVDKWRGSMLWTGKSCVTDKQIRVLPILRPAAILRKWDERHIAVHDLRRAARALQSDDWPIPDYRFISSPTFQQAIDYIAALRSAKRPVVCDIETTGRQISLIGLANSTTEAICIPLMTKDKPDGNYWTAEEEHEIIEALRGLLEDSDCGVIGQNFHYDAQYLVRHLGIWPVVVDDTMWMQQICFPGTSKSLDMLASLYARWYVYWKDELKDYRALPADEQKFRLYNCQDCVYTYEIWQALSQIIDRMRLREQYAFQLSMFNPVLTMMINGIRVDMSKRSELRDRISARMRELATCLEAVVGDYVGVAKITKTTAKWYRSPTQIKNLLYGEIGLPVILDRKTKQPTTNDEALDKLAVQQPILWPVCQWLKEYASLDTFVGTFLDARVDPDSRMRCSYNVAGTETFRFSSSQNAFGSGLNLQNIPRSDELNVRGMFVPDPGYAILDFDLASADLRVVIAETGARKLQEILDRGDDVYGTLSHKSTGVEYRGKKTEGRQNFKNVTHALDYVGGERTISTTYGIPLAQVKSVKTWYFHENPEIPAWHRKIERDLRSTKRVRNAFGYIRTYFDRVDAMLPNATAWIGQSTVGITINKGLMNLWNRLPWVQLLLQVHDSVVIQIPIDMFTIENVRKIQQCLLIPIHYSHRPDAPLVIPVGCKAGTESWGTAKDYAL